MIIVRWKVLSWKEKPQGELKIHQLRDNIRRHQFVDPPVFPNTFPISRGYSSYVWYSYLSPPHWLKPHYDKGLVLSGTHTPHEYQSLVYAR
jgi:hypothetical protein